MKTLFKKFLTIIILSSIPSLLFSQMWDYEQKDIEKIVWNDDSYVDLEILKPEWKEKSAVILDYELIHELKETSPTGIGHSKLKHYKVVLLDQVAVDNFSEFYFSKERTGIYKMYYKNFVGFRIIKPNGKIEIIDTEKEMIVEKDNYEVKQKIAIPNLQIGDVLDYYLFNYAYDYQNQIKQWEKSHGDYLFIFDRFLVPDKYPISKIKYEIITDKHWKLSIKPINDCPFREFKEGEGEYHFISESENVEALGDLEWDFYYKTRPWLKVYADWEPRHISKQEKEGAKTFSRREIDEKVLKDYMKKYYDADVSSLFGSFQKYLKKNNLTNLSKERKVEEYFYFLRHHFVNMHLMYDKYNNAKEREISHFSFCQHFIFALKKMDIKYDYLLTTPRILGDISDILSMGEVVPILKINFKTPSFIYFDGKFSRYDILPKAIEGVNCIRVKKSPDKRDFILSDYKIPTSNPEKNAFKANIDVKFSDNILTMNGKLSVKGQALPSYQNYFVSVFDFVIEENIKYNTKRWGDPSELKNGKMKDKILQMDQDQKDEFKEDFKEYLTVRLGVKELELNEVKKIELGMTAKDESFSAEYNCTTEELINKVGNNYIIKIGELTGDHFQVKEDELKREYDVYIPYPKMQSYEITLAIPENFELKGIENLTTSIENEYGSYKSTATIQDGRLVLKTNYKINVNFVELENWPKVAEILNTAFELQKKEVLLKKL
ncbi:MAG: hypothetical protein JEY96_06325 [Bacteroidales bacterium]|nr:hypothetical protein [Bacteroidales bacterium]